MPVNGVGVCDRDQFNGDAYGVTSDLAGLQAFWAGAAPNP
jgi:hypothetical protein